MLTSRQKKLIERIARFWDVKEFKVDDKEPLGSAGIDDDGNIVVNISTNMNEKETEIIRMHEYGHIYYEHVSISVEDYMDELQSIFQEVFPNTGLLSPKGAHHVLNICMDIQINSNLLTLAQTNYMKKQGKELCTAARYNVEPGLSYEEYFTDIIKQLKFKREADGTNTSISTEMPDIFLFDKDGKSDISRAIDDKGGYDKSHPFDNPFDFGDSDDSDEDPEEDEVLANITNINEETLKGIGNKHKVVGYIEYSEADLDEALVSVINELTDRKKGRIQDHVRLYNRRSRGNGPELYTSTKSFVRNEQPKLAVIVDVSGSMKQGIVMKVLKTISENYKLFHKHSEVILWDTSLCQKFNITEVPSYIKLGGGTELGSAVDYCCKTLESNRILLITDFGTNLDKLSTAIRSNNATVYGVAYDAKYYYNWLKSQDVMKKVFILN